MDDLDAAVARGLSYREAGADMIFPESLHNEAEFGEFAERCPGLLLANMTEFGKTPHLQVSRFGELGYDLVIYPVTMQRIAMHAVTTALAKLRAEGTAEHLLKDMQTRAELYDLIGYVPGEAWTQPRGPTGGA